MGVSRNDQCNVALDVVWYQAEAGRRLRPHHLMPALGLTDKCKQLGECSKQVEELGEPELLVRRRVSVGGTHYHQCCYLAL